MAKEYRIRIRGQQREDIDVDLMTQLVVMLGRQLAQEAQEREARKQPRDASQSVDEAGRGYDHDKYRVLLRQRGIRPPPRLPRPRHQHHLLAPPPNINALVSTARELLDGPHRTVLPALACRWPTAVERRRCSLNEGGQ
jgi:hypothetical protein